MALLLLAAAATAAKPNILMVVIDDLGYDDMGFKATKPQIKTPNVDNFARESSVLESYYLQPSCSPTRTTFMSGRYPLHTGINNYIPEGFPYGLAYDETTLADMLLEGGYSTVAIGKWHLGFQKWNSTPTFRGFEYFYGYYGGGEDYYNHTAGRGATLGYDLHRDVGLKCGPGCTKAPFEDFGKYSTFLYTNEAIGRINAHDTSKPLFMYLAYQAVHGPDEAPESYIEPYKHLGGRRAIYGGMLSCMDEGFGNVTTAWKNKGLMDNTILIFTSDNGGPSETCDVTGASNWPLRGSKCSLWEGGTRAAGFIWTGSAVASGKVKPNFDYLNFMHAADWMPTLAEATGLTCPKCKPWDGVSQWSALTRDAAAPRDYIYYGITDAQVGVHGPAIRVGCHKLILGDGGKPGGWEPPPNATDPTAPHWRLIAEPDLLVGEVPLPSNPNNTMLLFDLCEDPTEHNPLPHNANTQPIINDLHQRILNLWKSAVPGCPDHQCPGYDDSCPQGNPTKVNATTAVWMPWC